MLLDQWVAVAASRSGERGAQRAVPTQACFPAPVFAVPLGSLAKTRLKAKSEVKVRKEGLTPWEELQVMRQTGTRERVKDCGKSMPFWNVLRELGDHGPSVPFWRWRRGLFVPALRCSYRFQFQISMIPEQRLMNHTHANEIHSLPR